MHVVTPRRMMEIEGRAIRELGIDGLILMERAALALAQEVRACAPVRVLAVCGAGNNGGDAWACARMLHLWGIRTEILPLSPIASLRGDARKNAEICANLGIPLVESAMDMQGYDAIIDGIFGTGLSRAPEGIYADAIRRINQSGARVFSVDIPSGVDGATGGICADAVRADVTVTFQWAKRGHYLYPGAAHTGRLVIADIGIPDPIAWDDAEILTDADAEALKVPRARDAYKNQFGHALLAAGSCGMAGAAVLAATACMRSGAGLLTVIAPEKSVMPYVQQQVPTAMCIPLAEDGQHAYPPDAQEKIANALAGRSAVGCGCGLGRTPDRAQAVRAVLGSSLPAVLDADGLYHAAAEPELLHRAAPTVLTPHLGEMARLIGRAVEDPVKDAQVFAAQTGCVVLLKGACTVIAAPDGRLTLNIIGTQGMATAGSGDTLTGIILGLLAQGLDAYDAARLGAYEHAKAGLRAEEKYGTASMTALDMAQCVRI